METQPSDVQEPDDSFKSLDFLDESVQDSLTLGKARRVVVDVAEGDVDGGGGGQTAQLTSHVLGLEKNLVLALHLSIHVG